MFEHFKKEGKTSRDCEVPRFHDDSVSSCHYEGVSLCNRFFVW